ncbi:putative Carboxylesterase [Seiridium cardinale]
MKHLILALFCYGVTLAIAAITNGTGPNPTATIDSGVLIGTTTILPSSTSTVHKFLSVPFASPPERFRPSQPLGTWASPYNATIKYDVACFQNYIYSDATRDNLMKLVTGDAPPPQESEDCLTLDVFAPPPPANGTKKSVLFWIYGGSYRTGSNSNPNYDGSSFAANQDVILVSPNYRLNVHGFPANPQLEAPNQNLGLLDLRLALDWVRRNIAAFGGDPDKITLIGQSAGAAIVDMFVSAPPNPLPFRAAIMESGQATYNGAAATPGWAWNTLGRVVNCTGNNAQIYRCMRTTPAKNLKRASENHAIWFGPPVQDGVTWSKAPRRNRLNSTEEKPLMARVPILIGSTADEGAIYTTGVKSATAFLESQYGLSEAAAQALLTYYPIVPGGKITTEADRATAVMSESSFTCPAGFVYEDSTTVGISAWRYFFDASFANSELVPGAYHASEIPLVFGTYDRDNATTFQSELSTAMETAWADFAKDPVAGPGWNMSKVAVFGGNAKPGESDEGRSVMKMAEKNYMDARCFLYKP